MITSWFLGMLTSLAATVVSAFPTFTLPTWFSSTITTLSGGLPYLSGFSPWMPLSAFKGGVLFVASCFAIALAIRLARIVASFLTLGGGSAA